MQSTPALEPAVSSPPPQQKLSNLSLLALIFVGLFVLSELLCRFAVGLGNPPQYQADATMEYHLRPSKTYYRFHNRFAVNRYAMRSDDFPPQKSSTDELRVLVVGDSIVYGGVRLDQGEISPEILRRELSKDLRRPVVVGNASAKGWGPPNELAYLKRYGTLDADVVILELSSHDYADAPTFVPVVGVSVNFPDKRPLLALQDLFETYLLPRYLHLGGTPPGVDETLSNAVHSEKDIAECRDAERDFFRLARAQGAKVALVQHLSSPELAKSYELGYYANQSVAKEESVPFVDDAEGLRVQSNSKESPFFPGDPLHLNRVGQPILARALQTAVGVALKSN
jgi:hypothetical protein